MENQNAPTVKAPKLLIISEVISIIFGVIGVLSGLFGVVGFINNIDDKSYSSIPFFVVAILGISVSIILSFLILISKNLIAIRNKLYEEK